MGRMGGYNSEHRRYLINGREVTPEEFAQYRATGKLPGQGAGEQTSQTAAQGPKQDGILAKLGRNLTQEARDGTLTWRNSISPKNTKISWAWWHTPVILTTQDTEGMIGEFAIEVFTF